MSGRDAVRDEFVEKIAKWNCNVISPTKNLLRLKDREETKPASSLLMHTKQCGTDKAHFVGSSLTTKIADAVRSRLIADLKRLEETEEHDGRIYRAISEILSNKKRLEGLGRNEAEVRYAICDPLISMVCDCYSYTLKLKETVKNNLEMREVEDDNEEAVLVTSAALRGLWVEGQSAPPLPSSSKGTGEDMDSEEALGGEGSEGGGSAGAGPSQKGRLSIGGVMSKTSKADYAVYTLGHPGQPKVVAIIDAKKCITPHSVAQVIGYYSAFEVGDPQPLVVVLTAYELKIIIFPFHDGSQRLVNAVELEKFKLWKGEGRRMLDVRVLNLLLSLMDQESLLRKYSIEADQAEIPQGAWIPKNRVCDIVTDQVKLQEVIKRNAVLNRTVVRQQREKQEDMVRQQAKEKKLKEQLKKREDELKEQLKKREDELKELRRRQ